MRPGPKSEPGRIPVMLIDGVSLRCEQLIGPVLPYPAGGMF